MAKKCKLTNSNLSWVLEVDNERICFTGNADYLAEKFKELGYDVEVDRDAWQRR